MTDTTSHMFTLGHPCNLGVPLDLGPVVRALNTHGILPVVSTEELAAEVHNRAKALTKKYESFNYRKRPRSVSVDFNYGISVRPVEVLRELGIATTFFTRNPFTEASRLWAHARYCGTLETNRQGLLVLSQDANDVVFHHKTAQSEQLGIGFALLIAKKVLDKWYPDFEFQTVDADVALSAGFIETVGRIQQDHRTKMRPDYFLVGHRTGKKGSAMVVVLECKGTHKTRHFATGQLAKASIQVETVPIGNETPRAIMVATLLEQSGITAFVLDPPGAEELWSGSDEQLDDLLAQQPENLGLTPRLPSPEEFQARQDLLAETEDHIEPLPQLEPKPTEEEPEFAESIPAGLPEIFPIPESRRSWFLQVLARSAATSTLLYAGDATNARLYATHRHRGLSAEQNAVGQQSLFEDDTEQAIDAGTAWSSFRLNDDLAFEGTRYTIPLPGRQLLEVCRGVERNVYAQLEQGRIGGYWRQAKIFWERWSGWTPTKSSNDAVSLGRDGTALTVRIIDS